ncbi:hypothetical protein KFE80_06870 [bacterium SCSIO 12696]|nr:hypothetical protein KFE80_06870 [bacterium SCSIO 12696]
MMKRHNLLALTVALSAAIAGCQTQNPQSSSQLPQPPSSPSSSSPPSQPSSPSSPSSSPSSPSQPSGAPPSFPSSSRSGPESAQQSSRQSREQQNDSNSPETAEEIFGARTGSESRQSEEIPDLDAQPSGDGAEATHEELLDVLADIDASLERAANNPENSPQEQARIEQYQDVLGDIRVSVENGELDPAGEQALLDILADLEASVEAAERSGENGNNGVPVTITVEQVAILQDLIDIIGIPGTTPGVGFPSIPTLPGTSTARTGSETLGDLDAALEASIGVFDGMILSERVNAQGKPGEFEGEGSEEYTGGAEGLFEEGDLSEGEGQAGAGGQQQAESESPQFPGAEQNTPQNQSQGGGGGRGQAGNNAAIPDDIPDGRDDDIVARQIREAAQNEQDPELREKLWEEYRRYKQGK